MIEVILEGIGKKYGFQTIINDISLTITPSQILGIGGRNGSGKSTLLSIISSYLTPSKWKITFKQQDGAIIPLRKVFDRISMSAPSVQATDEMSLRELVDFHTTFRPFYTEHKYKELLELLELNDPKDKVLKSYSSGMRQKVNLALAILTQSDLLLLDEPTSYLDVDAKNWFRKLLHNNTHQRTIVIASNDDFDFYGVARLYRIENKSLIID